MSLMMAIPQFFEVAQQVGKGFRIELWDTQTPLDRKVKIINSAKSAPTAPFLFPSRSEGADDWSTAGGILSCGILPKLNRCPTF
jgi:hypothetical protein